MMGASAKLQDHAATENSSAPRFTFGAPMHVLFLPKWYPGRNDPQLGDFLRKQAIAVAGHTKVSVLHVAPAKELEKPETQELVEQDGLWELHCYYQPSTHSFAPLRKALNGLRYRKAFLHGWQRVLRERGLPELLHVHILLRPALMAQMIQRRYGIPYIISEQSSGYLDGSFQARGAIYGRLARRALRAAAGVTAVSAWLGDALVEQGLCKQYAVVPNVIPGLHRPLPARGTPGQLLVVADLVDKTKNVSGVLHALARARKLDARLRLTVIGGGPDRQMLEDLASQLELTDVVTFLGRLANNEVLDHMARCWAVVINSNVETFSVVTGEALAQGKPVIATRCGGPVAFVTPANGLLIDVRDDAALAAAMLELLAHPERHDAANIRRSVSERFSYEAVGRTFTDVYRKAMSHG
jgi:glycosyltransferase involved in cell wall biosynthesis